MKIIIAAVAALAFAGSVYASVPSTFVEKNAGVKATDQMELASGPSRNRGVTTNGNQNSPSRSAPDGGKSTYSR
jgi:hypothetical protein